MVKSPLAPQGLPDPTHVGVYSEKWFKKFALLLMDSDKPVCAPDLPLAPHVHACDLAILLNHMLVS